MATSLFGSSSAEEMQQALINQRAEAFGQQTNEQRLGSLAYRGGAGFGQALGGMFGVDTSDPSVRRASQRQEMMKGLDASDPAALLQMAQKMSQMGDFPAAQELAAKAQAIQQGAAILGKTNAEALKASREKEGNDPIQQLLRTGKFTAESVDAYSKSSNIKDLQAVNPSAKEGKLDSVGIARGTGQNVYTYHASGGGVEQFTFEVDPKTGQQVKKPFNGAMETRTATSDVKVSVGDGNAAMRQYIKDQQASGGKAVGDAFGKNIALGEGKQEALYAITDSLGLLKRGIYAGGYAPLEEGLAKYGMGIIGDKKRLANTQEFKAYLAEVVIPRLKDFGGSDTEQELKYLQEASGANTTIEPTALTSILSRLETKMQRGLARVSRQTTELQTGKPLSTGPVGEAVKPTRRYNPQTRTFEAIGGN